MNNSLSLAFRLEVLSQTKLQVLFFIIEQPFLATNSGTSIGTGLIFGLLSVPGSGAQQRKYWRYARTSAFCFRSPGSSHDSDEGHGKWPWVSSCSSPLVQLKVHSRVHVGAIVELVIEDTGRTWWWNAEGCSCGRHQVQPLHGLPGCLAKGQVHHPRHLRESWGPATDGWQSAVCGFSAGVHFVLSVLVLAVLVEVWGTAVTALVLTGCSVKNSFSSTAKLTSQKCLHVTLTNVTGQVLVLVGIEKLMMMTMAPGEQESRTTWERRSGGNCLVKLETSDFLWTVAESGLTHPQSQG